MFISLLQREIEQVTDQFAARRSWGWAADLDTAVVTLLVVACLLGLPASASAQSESSDSVDEDTALHRAAHAGDVVTLRRELDQGVDPDAANRFGVTPLALASRSGHASAVQRLLEAGADPNRASPAGETPLMVAARTGVVDSVMSLLEHGADPSARESWRGQTALMWAAAERHADVVRPLVAAGANVDGRSDAGFTPLMFATRLGHIETVDALLDAGADIHQTLPDGTSALVAAVINAHYDLAAHLLERGADPNASEQGWTALHQLVWTRRPNTNKNQHNPSPRQSGWVTDLELVEALVAHGADVNARQTKEPRDGYRNLLNRIGTTPFFLAAKVVDLELMRLLLDLGAAPLVTNEDGTTALLAAAGVGSWPNETAGSKGEALEAVKLMIELGDVATTIDAHGDTAVHGSVLRDAQELTLFLLDQGAELNHANECGWTPLTIAQGIFYGNLGRRFPDLEPVLLERGATSPLPPGTPGYQELGYPARCSR
jgi:ankyrin repeat protein